MSVSLPSTKGVFFAIMAVARSLPANVLAVVFHDDIDEVVDCS